MGLCVAEGNRPSFTREEAASGAILGVSVSLRDTLRCRTQWHGIGTSNLCATGVAAPLPELQQARNRKLNIKSSYTMKSNLIKEKGGERLRLESCFTIFTGALDLFVEERGEKVQILTIQDV